MKFVRQFLIGGHLWPFILAFAIFLASGTQNLAAPAVQLFFSTDKLAHFCIFGLLATSVIRIPYFRDKKLIGAICAVLIVSTYGGLDEWRQSFTPNRRVEFADWIADTLGALVAVTVYCNWTWYRNLLEMSTKKERQAENPGPQ